MKSQRNTWLALTLFAIAMGLLETIVVIYLRELYYPEGFSFPLKLMKPMMVSVELLRELSTLIMLFTAGYLAGRNATTRFAWFIYAFAIWDIFYYVFLKVLLNWPESLFTWDILFLIPLTWVGPVLGPVINSLTMIALAVILIEKSRSRQVSIHLFEWILLIVGSLVVILSYTHEYTSYMMGRFAFTDMFSAAKSQKLIEFATAFVPMHFDWFLYIPGVLLHWLAIGSLLLRYGKKSTSGIRAGH